jgi:hypothetical protein
VKPIAQHRIYNFLKNGQTAHYKQQIQVQNTAYLLIANDFPAVFDLLACLHMLASLLLHSVFVTEMQKQFF